MSPAEVKYDHKPPMAPPVYPDPFSSGIPAPPPFLTTVRLVVKMQSTVDRTTLLYAMSRIGGVESVNIEE